MGRESNRESSPADLDGVAEREFNIRNYSVSVNYLNINELYVFRLQSTKRLDNDSSSIENL